MVLKFVYLFIISVGNQNMNMSGISAGDTIKIDVGKGISIKDSYVTAGNKLTMNVGTSSKS